MLLYDSAAMARAISRSSGQEDVPANASLAAGSEVYALTLLEGGHLAAGTQSSLLVGFVISSVGKCDYWEIDSNDMKLTFIGMAG